MDVPAPLAKIVAQWCDAWNRGDAAAFAELFAEDGDFVNVLGAWWKPRSAIASAHARGFAGPWRGTKLQGRVESVRQLRDHVVLMHVRWLMTGTPVTEAAPGTARQSLATLVVVRDAGRWLVRAAHTTPVLR
jgi:uncharacterized protein (TIGR02246 family)